MEKIWLKSYPPGIPAEIKYDAYRSVGDLFGKCVAQFRERPAFYNMGKTITFADLDRQIAEAESLTPALASPDEAEEADFIHAIDLARAARLAPAPEAMRYARKARAALGAFTEAYPQSMRAAAAGVVLKGLGGTE